VDKNHKDKINEAILLCEKRFASFCNALDAKYSKEEASQIKHFLLQNTVFAGGVFRSVFTRMPVNDIDVWFTSLDAALEFKDRFMKPHVLPKGQKPLFLESDITHHGTFNWYGPSRKDPPLSFITKGAAAPMTLISEFDFSFNQHYFNQSTYEMSFDVDTFNKIGEYNLKCKTWKDKVRLFKRALRFMNDGFKIQDSSLLHLIGQIAGKGPLEMVEEELREEGSGGPETKMRRLGLTGSKYAQEDYFGTKAHKTAPRQPDWWIAEDPTNATWTLQMPNGFLARFTTLAEAQIYRDNERRGLTVRNEIRYAIVDDVFRT